MLRIVPFACPAKKYHLFKSPWATSDKTALQTGKSGQGDGTLKQAKFQVFEWVEFRP
jgi:hypothetical protein